ncbi:hypothetical protein [Antrihabitans cavernicola]|uniref:hypothetical protein n=1 Tax=Antrihabitans cavernicola TaxID=2495913 RepID=UPI00165953AF|nr:hypothetical protein [Spelaeibacter cavernicola]
MAIRVKDEFGEVETFGDATGFRTDEETNNLEVYNDSGAVFGAWAEGKWVSAVKLDED